MSEVSKKWNDKFKQADESKEQFLNLPICKKVKNIIDEASVNEYVKNKKVLEKNKDKFTDKVKKENKCIKGYKIF